MKKHHVGTRKKSNRKYWLNRDMNVDKSWHEYKGVFRAPLVCVLPLCHTLWSHICFTWHVERRQACFLPSHSSIALPTDGCVDSSTLISLLIEWENHELKLIFHRSISKFFRKIISGVQQRQQKWRVSTIIWIQHCPGTMPVNIHECVSNLGNIDR